MDITRLTTSLQDVGYQLLNAMETEDGIIVVAVRCISTTTDKPSVLVEQIKKRIEQLGRHMPCAAEMLIDQEYLDVLARRYATTILGQLDQMLLYIKANPKWGKDRLNFKSTLNNWMSAPSREFARVQRATQRDDDGAKIKRLASMRNLAIEKQVSKQKFVDGVSSDSRFSEFTRPELEQYYNKEIAPAIKEANHD